MKRFFDTELESLRSDLLRMGELVIGQLHTALAAYAAADPDLAQRAIDADNEIDELEVRIDDQAIGYISLRGPVATELRIVITAMKAGHELERVGDEVTKIARRARHLSTQPPLRTTVDIPQMGGFAATMLRDSLNCFFEGTEERAVDVCQRDAHVDRLNREVSDELTAIMTRQPDAVARGVDIIAISKAIERVADHATNIAEETIYLLKAKDVRHTPEVRHTPPPA